MEINLYNQTVEWQTCLSHDGRDDKTWAPVVTIPGRAVRQTHDMIDPKGEVPTAQYVVQLLLATEPQIDDLINGRQVIEVTEQITVQGQQVGFLARTR